MKMATAALVNFEMRLFARRSICNQISSPITRKMPEKNYSIVCNTIIILSYIFLDDLCYIFSIPRTTQLLENAFAQLFVGRTYVEH